MPKGRRKKQPVDELTQSRRRIPRSEKALARCNRGGERPQVSLRNSGKREPKASEVLASVHAVLGHQRFEDAAGSIFEYCKKLIGATNGYVALFREDATGDQEALVYSGGKVRTADGAMSLTGGRLSKQACRTRKPVYDNNYGRRSSRIGSMQGPVKLNNVLATPLIIEGEVAGLLALANKPRGFTKADARIASTLGGFVGVALYTSRALGLLQQSESRFRSIIRAANDAVICIDDRGDVVLWNDGAQTIFGYSATEMLGKPSDTVIPQLARKYHREQTGRLALRDTSSVVGSHIEGMGLRKDGTELPVEISLSAWEVGKRVFVTAIARDITVRQRLEREIVEATVREQRRIGQDLHDTLCQELAGVEYLCRALQKKLSAKSVSEAADAARIGELINQSMAQARSLARGLCLVELGADELKLAIRKWASCIADEFNVSCRFRCDVSLDICDGSVARNLYGIVQEAVRNAIKHGKAKHILIRLCSSNRGITLSVKDDGTGISDVAGSNGGMGVRIMKRRARMIDGHLGIQRNADGGTTVRCQVRTRKH